MDLPHLFAGDFPQLIIFIIKFLSIRLSGDVDHPIRDLLEGHAKGQQDVHARGGAGRVRHRRDGGRHRSHHYLLHLNVDSLKTAPLLSRAVLLKII